MPFLEGKGREGKGREGEGRGGVFLLPNLSKVGRILLQNVEFVFQFSFLYSPIGIQVREM